MKLKGFFREMLLKGLEAVSDERIKIRGEFRMEVRDAMGNLIEKYEELNTIVVVGRGQLARLLGGSVTGRSITKIGFGTNGTPSTISDTGLTAAYVKATGAVSYPDATSVLFAWTLGTSEANGKVIQEFGLLTQDDTLFSRKQRDPITKNSDISLTGTWKIIL